MKQDKEQEKRLFANDQALLRVRAVGPYYQQIWQLAKIKPGEKVLDVGCGGGVYGIAMAKQGAKVIGLDLAKEAIEFATRWARQEKVSFKGIVGDAEKLPFKNQSFDLVFFGALLHHLPDCSVALAEAKRVLKKNGRLVLAEPNGFNPVLRTSRFLGRFLPEKYAIKVAATKNETIHSPLTYTRLLNKLGFSKHQKVFFRTNPSHKIIPIQSPFLKIAFITRKTILITFSYLVPIFGCEYFLLSCRRAS